MEALVKCQIELFEKSLIIMYQYTIREGFYSKL